MRSLLIACLLAAPMFAATNQPGLLKSEFIYETAPFPECHASTIVETGGGLVTAWFGGTEEKHPDVGIWVSRHEQGKWTPPVEVATGVQEKGSRLPCWNPVLFQPTKGPLLLFYKVGPSPDRWWGMLISSTDNGKSWSAPRRLPDKILGPVKNKPIQLANGDILSGSSSEHDGWRVHFERSRDLGATWEFIGPVDMGPKIGAIQPSIILHSDGRLQALGRSRQKKVFTTESSDNGSTWTPLALLEVPNPNSGTDAVTLSDGRHLLVYNHSEGRSTQWDYGRSVLNVAVSRDGKNWEAALALESQTKGEYSYPAVIQTADGLVHITYTWQRKKVRHAIVDPAKFKLKPIVGGRWPY